jgi:hypothetical protein
MCQPTNHPSFALVAFALPCSHAESLQAMEDHTSDLYKELATLRLDPQDVADGLKRAAQEAKEEQLKGGRRAVHQSGVVWCGGLWDKAGVQLQWKWLQLL